MYFNCHFSTIYSFFFFFLFLNYNLLLLLLLNINFTIKYKKYIFRIKYQACYKIIGNHCPMISK